MYLENSHFDITDKRLFLLLSFLLTSMATEIFTVLLIQHEFQ